MADGDRAQQFHHDTHAAVEESHGPVGLLYRLGFRVYMLVVHEPGRWAEPVSG
ncbi:hypothetical protein I551_2067 [Mycobacterium ulcerans str. Harvey]|uniref:Uncharacterized protein n=1 Tax=Mycobacterium ulcerans str. Harvey TaxID=1299332 RepID=A0ABN0R3H5_MYCUL|nr:hypothetical protein I551_2067 [Mycobacterium ulcerans str. Harvey]